MRLEEKGFSNIYLKQSAMVESHKRPTTSRNRGFYVRMKFLNNNNSSGSRYGRSSSPSIEKSFCYRYFKWVLWLSLTLYFFSSFLITHKPPTSSLSKINLLPHTKASRALFESQNSTVIQQLPSVHQGLFFYLFGNL